MKTLLILIIAASTFIDCSAKDKSFKTFYRDHKSDKGLINMNIPPLLARMVIPNEEKIIRNFLKETSSLRIMIQQESNDYLAKELNSCLEKGEYNDLMYIRDGSDIVRITARCKNKKIEEIIITVNDNESFVALQLVGNYSMELLKELVKQS